MSGRFELGGNVRKLFAAVQPLSRAPSAASSLGSRLDLDDLDDTASAVQAARAPSRRVLDVEAPPAPSSAAPVRDLLAVPFPDPLRVTYALAFSGSCRISSGTGRPWYR